MNSSQGSWLGKRHSWQVNGLFRLLRTGLDKAPFVSLNKLNILLRIFIASSKFILCDHFRETHDHSVLFDADHS